MNGASSGKYYFTIENAQLSGNLHGLRDNFLVDFHVFENSGPGREVYADFGSITTVDEGST